MFYKQGLKISQFLCKSPTINSAKQLSIGSLPYTNNFSIKSSVKKETNQRLEFSRRKSKLSSVPELGNSQQEILFHSSNACSTDASSSTSDSTYLPKVGLNFYSLISQILTRVISDLSACAYSAENITYTYFFIGGCLFLISYSSAS